MSTTETCEFTREEAISALLLEWICDGQRITQVTALVLDLMGRMPGHSRNKLERHD